MMFRTHVVMAFLFILLFIPHVSNKLLFLSVAVLATMLPDIDSASSTLGRMSGFRIFQFFMKHRGILHSFSFCIALSILLAVFLPAVALPFFLGYSIHLFADSFTLEGIRPFWPLKKTSSWRFRTGSMTETTLFLGFLIADFLIVVMYIKNIVV